MNIESLLEKLPDNNVVILKFGKINYEVWAKGNRYGGSTLRGAIEKAIKDDNK